jgi:voltage-gated potassium channel
MLAISREASSRPAADHLTTLTLPVREQPLHQERESPSRRVTPIKASRGFSASGNPTRATVLEAFDEARLFESLTRKCPVLGPGWSKMGDRDQDTVGRRTPQAVGTAMDWPLSIAALIFLAAFAIPILNPDLRCCQGIRRVGGVGHLGPLCFGLRGPSDPDPRPMAFLISSWRSFRVLRPFRLLRLLTVLTTVQRQAGASSRCRVGIYLAGGSALIIFVGSLAMLDRERADPEANIKTFGDSVWWAFTTVITVGYGDHYPVTALGRWIAVMMMLSGIALIGTVTATLATWLIDQIRIEANETRSEESEA